MVKPQPKRTESQKETHKAGSCLRPGQEKLPNFIGLGTLFSCPKYFLLRLEEHFVGVVSQGFCVPKRPKPTDTILWRKYALCTNRQDSCMPSTTW